jgi:molybdopterin synthase catalytic subunit
MRLTEGDEIAFFPPVSGGSGASDDKFAITFDPISLDDMAGRVLKPETGAVAVFAGVVRNVSAGKAVEHLEYEAYEGMAVAKLRQVAVEAREQWPDIVDMAIIQRIGHLEVGENAVVVAVSSPHRGDGCFEACQYAINRLKQIVPIWKKEVSPDGSEWVEGEYLPSTQDAR